MIPYTQWNLGMLIAWLCSECPHNMGAILWCNSLAVVASYESIRIINPISYKNFLTHSISRWREDIIAHWLPILLIWNYRRNHPKVKTWHACTSILLETLWGYSIGFDLKGPYPGIQPPLSRIETYLVWICGLMGHIAPLRLQMDWRVPYTIWTAAIIRRTLQDKC